jgi:lipopolysaccharide/colanic/teichoic acid biosynthesis glycosyltransferase
MYPFLKRIFDVVSSLIVLSILFPFLLLIAIIITLESRGGIFYKQIRVGKNGVEFGLLKFRSMRSGADKAGQLTVGEDRRVTKVGKFIRKYKIDEFPQLLNVIGGQMSIVGPRPEVPKYVALYDDEQKKVLSVKPGLTDLATIEFINEQAILGESNDAETTYINIVMPAKLTLNLEYINKRSFFLDLRLIFKTIISILK